MSHIHNRTIEGADLEFWDGCHCDSYRDTLPFLLSLVEKRFGDRILWLLLSQTRVHQAIVASEFCCKLPFGIFAAVRANFSHFIRKDIRIRQRIPSRCSVCSFLFKISNWWLKFASEFSGRIKIRIRIRIRSCIAATAVQSVPDVFRVATSEDVPVKGIEAAKKNTSHKPWQVLPQDLLMLHLAHAIF